MIFQMMALLKAERMRRLSTMSGLTMPTPIVLATWTPTKKKAENSKNAAHRTAYLGGRALVETTVDMALAESWKPLRKSKTSATKMRITTNPKESGMFQDDAFNDVSDILADIYGLFYPLEYFLPLDELDGILLLLKQAGHGHPHYNIAFILQCVDFHTGIDDHLGVFHISHGMNYMLHLLDRLI